MNKRLEKAIAKISIGAGEDIAVILTPKQADAILTYTYGLESRIEKATKLLIAMSDDWMSVEPGFMSDHYQKLKQALDTLNGGEA